MAKGEVRIKLNMEIDEAKKNIKDIYSLMEKTSKQLQDTKDKLNNRGEDDFVQTLSKNLEKVEKQIDKEKDKLSKLNKEYDKYAKAYEKASKNGDKLGMASAQKGMEEVDLKDAQTTSRIIELEAQRDKIIQETTNSYNKETEALKNQQTELESSLKMQAGALSQETTSLSKLENPFTKIKAGLSDMLSNASKLGKSLLNSVGGVFNKLFHKDSTKSLNKGMTSILGTTKRFGMALLGAYSAYSLITRAVSQIKEDNKELAGTMNSLWNGLVALITPAVNAIVNAFATALNYVIKIASVISGINILGKIKQANKKANSKKSGSGSSNNLYSFDTSETLQKNGGSGDSTTEGYLKDIELNEKLLKYAEKLKQIWNNIAKTGQNIVARIQEAWEYMNSGERILTVLDNLLTALLDDLIEITQATLEWSETINFGPLFDSIANVLESMEPILEAIGDLFVWVWKEVILPFVTWLTEEFLPVFNNCFSAILDVVNMALEPLKEILLFIWETILQPVAEFIGGIIIDVLTLVKDTINDNQDELEEFFEVMAEVWRFLRDTFAPFVKSALNNLRELFKVVMEGISENFGDTIEGITLALRGVLEFLTGVFSGDWEKAWQGIKDIFGGIWNTILSIVEGVLNGIVNGYNWVADKLNALSIDLPDWAGGGTFGISVPKASGVDLSQFKYVPALAQGAIIPPNKEFLALLGDQTRGKNIEAPEGLLREIVQEESRTQEINIVANGTMSQLIKLLRLELQKEDKRVGSSLVVGG